MASDAERLQQVRRYVWEALGQIIQMEEFSDTAPLLGALNRAWTEGEILRDKRGQEIPRQDEHHRRPSVGRRDNGAQMSKTFEQDLTQPAMDDRNRK